MDKPDRKLLTAKPRPAAWQLVGLCLLLLLIMPIHSAVAVSDHPYHFGFKKSKNGQLPSIDEEGFKSIIDRHGAVFLGDTAKKELYLTFDNGYENGYTPRSSIRFSPAKCPPSSSLRATT